MLNDSKVSFTYREYTADPLSEAEIRAVVGRMGLTAHDVVRGRDAKKLELDVGSMDQDALFAAMARHPTLLQRPIMDNGTRAVLGRPFERVLEVV